MRNIIRILLIAPALLVLVLFVVTNRAPVSLGLWPTDYTFSLPLSVLVLGAAGLAFLVGGLLVWFGTLRLRRELRRAADRIRALEDRIEALKSQPSDNPALPPPNA
jgi:uncharacterized integral membrane protein